MAEKNADQGGYHMKLSYTVADATGSITLLVTTPVEPALRTQVGARLLSLEKKACQVAFLDQTDGTSRLAAAGGQFDANAAMILAALLAFEEHLAVGESQDLQLSVSGADGPVTCTVTPVWRCDMVTLTMPLPEKITDVAFPLSGGSVKLPVVSFPGADHIIVPAGMVDRTAAPELLTHWSALLPAPAAGMLFWDEEAASFDPLLYVKAAAVARWVPSSADGAAAIAAWLTMQRRADQALSLKQPGGTIAAVTRWRDGLTSLTVSGTVDLKEDKSADIIF